MESIEEIMQSFQFKAHFLGKEMLALDFDKVKEFIESLQSQLIEKEQKNERLLKKALDTQRENTKLKTSHAIELQSLMDSKDFEYSKLKQENKELKEIDTYKCSNCNEVAEHINLGMMCSKCNC